MFVDLYAGSGMYSIGHQRARFFAPALQAVTTQMPISKWVLCEANPDNLRALKVRVGKYFRGKNVHLLEGRPEELLEKLEHHVPTSKGSYKAGVCCVVDPFSLETPFAVLEKLATRGYSLVMPFTFALNDKVDYKFYLTHQRERLIRFLGGQSQYDQLASVTGNAEFYKRLVKIYQNNMLMLGLNGSLSVHKLDSGLMTMPAYYVGFFSRQFSVKTIRREAVGREHVQFELF